MESVVIILGAANDADGALTSSALARLDRGIREYVRRPGSLIMPTGGYGDHFNTTAKPHAAYAREYLLARGIPPDRILPCVESSNTVEDAFLSAKALAGSAAGETAGETAGAIVIVTSDYHVPRAEFLFGIAFAGKALTVCAAEDRLDPSERRIREEHERRALEALRANGVSWGGKILR